MPKESWKAEDAKRKQQSPMTEAQGDRIIELLERHMKNEIKPLSYPTAKFVGK